MNYIKLIIVGFVLIFLDIFIILFTLAIGSKDLMYLWIVILLGSVGLLFLGLGCYKVFGWFKKPCKKE